MLCGGGCGEGPTRSSCLGGLGPDVVFWSFGVYGAAAVLLALGLA